MTPKVSIVIANRNDLQMLVVTVRSALDAAVPLGKGATEIVIVDNSDEEIYKLLPSVISDQYVREGTIKIIRQPFPCLATARETAIRNASAPYVYSLDSHMLSGRNSIIDLVDFMDRHKDDPTVGFAHAPLSWAHQHESHSKHDRNMTVRELGDWGSSYDYERTITWKGMPWICRRDWFLDSSKGLGGYGAHAEYRLSWGGGDMLVGIKPWLLGFKNWAIPTTPCVHIGPFPNIDYTSNKHMVLVSKPTTAQLPKYRQYSASGNYPYTFGYLVSCYVLGGEPMMLRNKPTLAKNFASFINLDEWWEKAKEIGAKERQWILDHQVMSFEELLERKPWNEVPLKIERTA